MHYANGRLAKVGDRVIGRTYNTGKEVISGTVMSITPSETDSCSVLLGYLVTVPITIGDLQRETQGLPVKIHGSEQHGYLSAGSLMTTLFKTDYTDCKSLLHVQDVWHIT
jgi:hypothetical protein